MAHDSGFLPAAPWANIALAAISTLYIAWRLWKFNLRPLLYPEEPLVYPYLIPGLGHAFPFFRNTYQLFDNAVEYFGSSRPVYTLVLAGKPIYVVTNSNDTQELYKNSASFSWESFIEDMYVWMGFSPNSLRTLFHVRSPSSHAMDPVKDRPPFFMMSEFQRQQLLPGEKSRAMSEKLLDHMRQSQEWDALKSYDFATELSRTAIEVDLFAWTSYTFIKAVTEVYWGPKILELNPQLLHDYAQWEHSGWKLFFQLPKAMSGDMHLARDSLVSTFQQYFDLDSVKRTETNYWVSKTEQEFRQAGLDNPDIGRVNMLIHWAVNGNMHKISFWMLLEILRDHELRQQVESELLPASPAGEFDTSYEKCCPHTDAVWHEVLRMRMATSLARTVITDTRIGGKILKRGSDVMVPFKVLHKDETVFGDNPEKFDKTRFLKKPSLASHVSFKPFGGGAHLCPGRFIGKKAVYSFIAVALSLKPSVNVDKGCGNRRPQAREDKPGLGSLPPVQEDRVFVRLHQQVHELVDVR